MELYQKFQVVQFIVILATCLVGLRLLWEGKSPEKTYILPFCIIDLVVTGIIVINHLIGRYPNYFQIIIIIFSWCEIFFISQYISSVIGRKKNTFRLVAICLLSPICSYILLHDYTLFPMLITGIYLSYCSYLYLEFLITQKNNVNVSTTPHYWIILGTIVCYTASIPYWISEILFKLSNIEELNYELSQILFTIFVILNICLHLIFIKAFICKYQQHKLLLGQFQSQ